MDAKLVVVSGQAQAAEFPLSLPAMVGRSRGADIKLGHALVSRKHCELYESDGQLMIRDLGSLNGTFVGDGRISDVTVLPPGAMVTVGAVTFQAVYGDMADETAAADPNGLPEFMAPSSLPMRAAAAPIEQTIEMSEADSPATEPASGVDRDAGIDFGWLNDPEEQVDEPQASAALAAKESVDDAQASRPAEEKELNFLEPMKVGDHGETGGAEDEFTLPEQQPTTAGNDDDLSDFFASLK